MSDAHRESPAVSVSSPLLDEFGRFVDEEMRSYFALAAGLSDLDCRPYGNLGTLAPVGTFLSLCGLPLPSVFDRWAHSCTAYAPFLRGHLRFYLDAQHRYVRTLVGSLERRFEAADTLHRDALLRGTHVHRKPVPPHLAQAQRGFANLHLEALPESPRGRLHWRGHPVHNVTTLDEWIRVTQGLEGPVHPGARVTLVTPEDPSELPFFAVNVVTVETGPHKGKVICRRCFRPAKAECLVHYDLSPDHPLSQWLSGYEVLPDQMRAGAAVHQNVQVAGDWASLPATDPWRQLIVSHLQAKVSRSFILPLS